MKLILPVLALTFLAACSKIHLPTPPEKGFGNLVSWRFVEYDSTNRVVDSTRWIATTDSILNPAILGPGVISIAPIPGPDTIYWQPAAIFEIIVGPYNFGPQLGNLQVAKGGCAINVIYNQPTLDRSGWNLQRTENGRTIDMFAPNQLSSYDGKYNDFPYPNYYNGVAFPDPGQSDYVNESWICGSTQGSCQLSPVL
jgi:hypothetical protein